MTIICDTNVPISDALAPQRLSHKAAERLVQGEERGDLACVDISLWEIAMLVNKGRVRVETDIKIFLRNVISARKINVLPITIEIAELSQHTSSTTKTRRIVWSRRQRCTTDRRCSHRINDCMRSMPWRPCGEHRQNTEQRAVRQKGKRLVFGIRSFTNSSVKK